MFYSNKEDILQHPKYKLMLVPILPSLVQTEYIVLV